MEYIASETAETGTRRGAKLIKRPVFNIEYKLYQTAGKGMDAIPDILSGREAYEVSNLTDQTPGIGYGCTKLNNGESSTSGYFTRNIRRPYP